MRVNRAHALLMAGLWASLALPVRAEDWFDYAMVSNTVGTEPSRLCMGLDNATIACPTYAPSLTTAGDISVTGNLSASKFIGDGSGLTGLSTTSDRITSGTSSIIVSNSGHISFTTAGTERMVINSSGNVGVGTSTPNVPLTVEASTPNLFNLRKAGNTWGLLGSVGNNYLIGATNANNGAVLLNVNNAPLGFGANNGVNMIINGSGNVGVGLLSPTATLQVSGSFTVSTSAQTTTPTLWAGTNGRVGIGTSEPSTTFHVFGSGPNGFDGVGYRQLQLSNGTTNSMPIWAGSVSTNQSYFAFNTYYHSSSQYKPSVGSVAGGLKYESNGRLDLFNNGSLTAGTAYTPTERLSILSTGNVGIGTTSPNKTLAVSGTAEILSRTIIGGIGTPSATLQVSGSLLLAGSDSTTCNDAYIGILRRNPITGKLQVCK